MEKVLRRCETNLWVSGIATIVFWGWSVIKVFLSVFLAKEWEDLRKAFMGQNLIVRLSIIGIVLAGLLIILFVRLSVGLSAYSEGRGKKRGYGYLFPAAVLALWVFLNLLLYSYALFFVDLWGFLNGTKGARDVGRLLTDLAAVLLDVTSLYSLLEVIIFSVKVKKLRKSMAEKHGNSAIEMEEEPAEIFPLEGSDFL